MKKSVSGQVTVFSAIIMVAVLILAGLLVDAARIGMGRRMVKSLSIWRQGRCWPNTAVNLRMITACLPCQFRINMNCRTGSKSTFQQFRHTLR